MKYATLLLTGLIAALACGNAGAQTKNMEQVGKWLEGNFSSKAQAAADADYVDIRLHIKRVWKQRADGFWFYMELAMATAPDKPTRQRFYHVSELADGRFETEVYTVNAPQRFTGAWKNPQILRGLTPDSLQLRAGCSVMLAKYGDTYAGAIEGKACASETEGGAYTTNDVELTATMLTSWERCFDKEGRQVSGPAKGAYQFRRE